MRPHRILVISLALGTFGLVAPPLASHELGPVVQRVLDVSPERLDAFKRTLREFGGALTVEEAAASGIFLESSYSAPPAHEPRARAFADDDDLRVPPGVQGRDLVADEMFLIEGREEEFQDAARRWVSRRLKGSDAHRSQRSSVGPVLAWTSGPVVGVRTGPVSSSIRPDGWRVRYRRPLQRLPGWVALATVGREDGDDYVTFSIGRSIATAATSR